MVRRTHDAAAASTSASLELPDETHSTMVLQLLEVLPHLSYETASKALAAVDWNVERAVLAHFSEPEPPPLAARGRVQASVRRPCPVPSHAPNAGGGSAGPLHIVWSTDHPASPRPQPPFLGRPALPRSPRPRLLLRLPRRPLVPPRLLPSAAALRLAWRQRPPPARPPRRAT